MPSGRLNEKCPEVPTYGCDSLENTNRSMELASVAVPTVERADAPIRSWSIIIAGDRFSSTSTSGRGSDGMKP